VVVLLGVQVGPQVRHQADRTTVVAAACSMATMFSGEKRGREIPGR
jgi:hypothetical protein